MLPSAQVVADAAVAAWVARDANRPVRRAGRETAGPPRGHEPAAVARIADQGTMRFPVAELAALYTAVVSELNFGPCMADTPE